MQVSKLDKKIIIQKRKEQFDEIGNHTYVWDDYFKCHASFTNASGSIISKNSQSFTTVNADFTVWPCRKIKNVSKNYKEYRIVYNNDFWKIKFVDDSSFHKDYLVLKTERDYLGNKD